MPVLNSQPIGNSYPASPGTGPAALANIWNSRGGWFSITGASAYVQLQYGDLAQAHWVEEILLGAGAFVVVPSNCRGMQFRNAVPNAIATVTAQIAQGDEPPLAISSFGQTNVVSVASLNFQHNTVAVGTEPTLDFEDAAGVITWTVLDDVPGTRVKLTPAFTSPALFPGAVGIGGNAGDTALTRLAAGVVGVNNGAGAFSTGPLSLNLTGSQTGGVWLNPVNGNVAIFGGSVYGNAVTFAVTTDTVARHEIGIDGALRWGPGGASALDSTFQRIGPQVLGDTGTSLTTGPPDWSVRTANGVFLQRGSSTGGGIWSIGANTGFTALDVSVQNDTNPRFFLSAAGAMQWGPGNAATDVNLYRAQAGVLHTDQTFTAVDLGAQPVALAGNEAIFVQITGEANRRLQILGDGSARWGNGTSLDVSLHRATPFGFGALAVDFPGTGANGQVGSAAGVVLAEDGFQVISRSSSPCFFTTVPGDTTAFRFQIGNDGGMSWGPGSAATDTTFFRAGVGQLRVNTALGVNATPGSAGTITCGDRIFSGAASTGGIWVDGGANQFFGSNSATIIGVYNAGWRFVIDNAGFAMFANSYGWQVGVGAGAAGSVAGTSITQNKITGSVTFTGQSNTASVLKSFVVTDSLVGANDNVLVTVNNSTTAAGQIVVSAVVTAGSFTIVMLCNSANAGVTYSFNYSILKGTVS